MKPIPFVRDTVLGTACVAILAAMASGQNPIPTEERPEASPQQQRRQREEARPRARANRREAGQQSERIAGHNLRASKLIGMSIENAGGENVGSINDLVLDSRTGRIRYAAVSYGGFLGVGDKLFAVPFEAFKVQKKADDADTYVVVLNVTQNQLEGSVGFDDENWPDFADRKFTDDIDKRYGVDRRLRDADVDINVAPAGLQIEVESAQPDSPKDTPKNP